MNEFDDFDQVEGTVSVFVSVQIAAFISMVNVESDHCRMLKVIIAVRNELRPKF